MLAGCLAESRCDLHAGHSEKCRGPQRTTWNSTSEKGGHGGFGEGAREDSQPKSPGHVIFPEGEAYDHTNKSSLGRLQPVAKNAETPSSGNNDHSLRHAKRCKKDIKR